MPSKNEQKVNEAIQERRGKQILWKSGVASFSISHLSLVRSKSEMDRLSSRICHLSLDKGQQKAGRASRRAEIKDRCIAKRTS